VLALNLPCKKKGLTLLEVLIATFILTFGILALFGMFPTSALAVSDARNTYSATEVAREKLETWAQKGYSTLPAVCQGGSGGSPTLDTATINYTDTANGNIQTWAFTYTVSCSSIVTNEVAQIESYVQWHPKGWASAQQNSVRLDSWVINGWQTP